MRLWDITNSPTPHAYTPSPPHKRRRMDTSSTKTALTRASPGTALATQHDVPDPPTGGAPPLTSPGVTRCAAPGPHAGDAPCRHSSAAPALGPEPSRPACRRSTPATAACTRPDQAQPRPRHPTGQRQRTNLPGEPPWGRPSPTTPPSIAPCSDPLLTATPPATATEHHAGPRPEDATRTWDRWTPTHAPTGTCSARRRKTHARSRQNRLTRQSRLAPAEAKSRVDEHEPCPTTSSPPCLTQPTGAEKKPQRARTAKMSA